ncbi:endo-alpha-N-acetylgalactosaminidase family protein [Pseudoflavonifractor phocaeensis]|uniref:endo-alpha-N-acetylgalactosaminidase family protein n=1 Tax=Pseudoflavonifractor phocaeensis TaxID=1870988 RepID=UPI00210CC681|nr:endo-alpha-N-acetylgalactosaminidase family protein [Pseudoflavonifractor phocaeensis]MCQ4865860.1 endo-alpha-N-acetylgalactosaminidase family protein [Pseudoflavonifractor phocaeensis]
MTRPKSRLQKALALLLTLCMVLSLLPAAAAEEPPPAEEPAKIEDTDTDAVVWGEGWHEYTDAEGQTTHYSNTGGSAVTVHFTGTGIAVYGKKAFNGPILKAVIDDGESADVDFYGDGALGDEQEAWKVSGLGKGDHTLVLTISPEHNESGKPSSQGLYQTEINYFLVTNEEAPTEPEEPEVPETPDVGIADGAVHDLWEQDPATVKGEGAVNELRDGKRYLKAGTGNRNGETDKADNPYPAVFLDKTLSDALAGEDVNAPHFLEFTLERVSEHTNNYTQFGVYLNYKDPGNAFFIGCDAGGWFWQTLSGGSGAWYQGGRVALPAVGEPVAVRLEWTGTSLTKATANGQDLFPGLPLDFSASGGNSSNAGTVGFKVGRWADKSTEIMVSGLTYTGQRAVTAYVVSGTVTDAKDGAPIAGAAVTIAGKTVFTDSEGKYSFDSGNKIADGVYTAIISKEGYADGKLNITVDGAALEGQDAVLSRLPSVSGTVTGEGGAPLKDALVELGGRQAVTGADGQYTIAGVTAGTYTLTVSAEGYISAERQITVAEDDLTGISVQLPKLEIKTATLSTDGMDVLVDTAFPRVIQYTMKGGSAGKVFYGQTAVLDTLRINGVDVKPAVSAQASETEAAITYTMAVKDAASRIDAVITAEITAAGNTLEFHITNVEYADPAARTEYPIESIEIPDHSLISVRSTQPGADLAAARLGVSTIKSGDYFRAVDDRLNVDSLNGQRYMYVFLSNDELSAGISGNSDIGTGGAAKDNHRITLSARDSGAYKSVGAGSSLWYYDRNISSSDPHEAGNANLTAEEKVVGIREGVDEMPYVKVVITGDENGDGAVDWQDGAIAARENEIIHIPAYSDSIPDLVSTRISMNFQSEAANPFLTALDNVKRVSLHSDGLGQSILLKGYANEGHDSGHPDYYDIGRRMGGAEDMMTMLVEGRKYGAEFGIHVNASEFYPESKSFNEDMVSRDGSGGLDYRWNWLDQGIGINGVYDLASGNRMERWDKLYAQVADELDYVYVDVWGNYTSGAEDAWQTRKLSNEIISHDWRIVHEWGSANDWDSTFQHWVSDFTYGENDQKGQLNSAIMRFMLNSHKDSFVPDFPTYGGAANAPLLGGPVMQGFEGWQGDVEYDLFIDTLYNQMLPTKFLQHYDIMKWVDNDEAVTIPYGVKHSTFSESTTSQWTPEVQITLQSQDRKDTVVVTRGSDGEINDTYAYGTAAERLEYRSRNITLNGRVVLTGASNPGDFTGNAPAGNLKYLLPWYWKTAGDTRDGEGGKLYHYNVKGGESTWHLPEGWDTLSTVKVYKLTDQGRTGEQTVAVADGWITLENIEAETPYVVVKGENGAAAPAVEWSTGMHLKDVSFNGALTDSWTVDGGGSAEVVYTNHEIPMLKMDGQVSVSQVMTGLKAGQRYAVYVGVDNRSDARAVMTVSDSEGNVLSSNYTLRSIARNYVGSYVHRNAHPTEDGASCFQNMYVFFTAPESGDLTLTLSREDGEGGTYFDDVRVVENESDHFTYDADGSFVSFTQDFEHVAQGLFPFVVGPAQGDTDGRTHLSELHAPYTQAGWDVKKVSDVLGGDWSVKINGLTQLNSVVYYTIPQNFHFDPGVTYTVSFDYQMGSEGTYDVVYGSGVYNGDVTAVPLSKAQGTTARCTFTLIGDESGQTWFGIRSTGRAADTQGTTGSEAVFGGYKDFILDNLTITVSQTQKNELNQFILRGDGMLQADYSGDWEAFEAALAAARAVMADQDATQAAVDQAARELSAAILALTRLETNLVGTVTDGEGAPISGAVVLLEDDNYIPTGAVSVTDDSGRYAFTWLTADAYQLKITADGYDVSTVNPGALTAGETNTVDATLTVQALAAYVNTFDSKDISMMKPMAGNAGGGKDEVMESVPHNGGSALKVTYNNNERNTVVDDSLQMKNGTVEVDVTPLVSGVRFGITLRGQDLNNRIYVGPFDNAGRWGWNCFVNGQEAWSSEISGPGLYANVTRRVKVTLDENTLSLWVDGVLLMDKVAIRSNPTEAGYVGLNAGRNAGTRFLFDNLRITPADEPAAESHPITGKVLNSAGEGVTGAQIIVRKGETDMTRTTTGAEGGFVTLPLEQGEYTLRIAAVNYLEKTVTAVVADGTLTLEDTVLGFDRGALAGLYDQYRALEQEGYSEETWKLLQDALASAKTVLDKEGGAADSELLSAYESLRRAAAALAADAPDKNGLRALYETYRNVVDLGYTAESWAAFQAALTDAAAVLNDKSAAQKRVDAARDALQSAYDGLTFPFSGPAPATTTRTEKNPDGSVTTTVTNRRTGTVTVTTKWPDGKTMETVTTRTGGKTITVTGPDGGGIARLELPAEVSAPGTAFTDVAEDNWAKSSVDFVAGMGLFNGTPGGAFDGLLPMTRGMLACVLHRLSGELPGGGHGFEDVAHGVWYAPAVSWAASAGIVTGVDAAHFGPEQSITRETLAVMLYRYAGMLGMETSADLSLLDGFCDGGEASAWAQDAMAWAVRTGILSGKNGESLDPAGAATRYEVAAMLERFVKLL